MARYKGVVNSRSVPMNGYKHSKEHMVTLTNKQICALTNTDYGSSLVRLSLSLRAKKINLDMLSSVLSSGSLYNLQYRSFIDTPVYTGKGNFSLNWLYTGHTKSTWLSSSVMSTQKGQNRWFSATKKRSLRPCIRETPIRKRANAVLYTLLCTTSRYLSRSKAF